MENTLTSAVKLELYWVSFLDSKGQEHRRMAFKNPDGRILLWDMGTDRPYGAPTGGEQSFEGLERLSIERMSEQLVSRCPDWLQDQIVKSMEKEERFNLSPEEARPVTAKNIKEIADKAVKEGSMSVGDVGKHLG